MATEGKVEVEHRGEGKVEGRGEGEVGRGEGKAREEDW